MRRSGGGRPGSDRDGLDHDRAEAAPLMNWPPASKKIKHWHVSVLQPDERWRCIGQGPQGPADEISSGWREEQ